MAERKRWTRDELLVVLNIYHKLNFGQFHHRQLAIIELVDRMCALSSVPLEGRVLWRYALYSH